MASFRPEHKPKGDPCELCTYPADRHKKRVRPQRSGYNKHRWEHRLDKPRGKRQDRIVGIDGEGSGRRKHRYTFLAAADEFGKTWDVGNSEGLTTDQCLDFLVNLPDRALVVAYAFMYDLTKILEGLPNSSLYYLFHEKTRAVLRGSRLVYRAIAYGPYLLNFMNRRFTIIRNRKRITVWDIFAFFQGKFTEALRDWKICPEEEIAVIEDMKEQRSNFANVDPEQIKDYCRKECINLALLCRELINAHRGAGLELQHYYGAGSTASALLNKLEVKQYIAEPIEEMRDAVARSFFGGRFETSHLGPIPGPVYNADITSAYPYHLTFLPCLTHGQWSRCENPTESDIANARLALVHWHTPFDSMHDFLVKVRAWGPFPVRSKKGTIMFPLGGKGGWVWKDEFIAGKRIAPEVVATEAWLYHTTCDCQPFKDLPKYYLERLKWGKDAKGKPLKLGPNAVYGKLAQSKGLLPPFQCWIWSCNITSGCRAQLLDAIAAAPDPWHVLQVATDGVWSRTKLELPQPRFTNTETARDFGKEPLGGWEQKDFPEGVFCVRPGIYFPLKWSTKPLSSAEMQKEIKEVRARGVGKKSMYEQISKVIDAWDAGKMGVTLSDRERFVGAKSGVRKTAEGFVRSEDYGEWVPWDSDVDFNPEPKRDGRLGKHRLKPWTYLDWESEPYVPATKSKEALALMLAEIIAMEQPEGMFLENDQWHENETTAPSTNVG